MMAFEGLDEKDREGFQRDLAAPLPGGIIRSGGRNPDAVTESVVADEMAAFRALSGQTKQLGG